MWKMQRLFGSFPSQGPGFALLLLRLTVAVVLISRIWFNAAPGLQLLLAVYALAAGMLIVGSFTPAVAALTALILTGTTRLSGEIPTTAMMITILVALSLLGAGSYSVDARIYGRRRIILRSAAKPEE